MLQFNLGEVEYRGRQFSTDEPAWEDVRFAFPEGDYDTTAKRAPITDGLGTYEIKGSEAAFVAGLLQGQRQRVDHAREASFSFPLERRGRRDRRGLQRVSRSSTTTLVQRRSFPFFVDEQAAGVG